MSENDQNILSNPQSWVDLYGDYLYNYAFSRISDKSAAEDIVQETFLAALKARDKFAGNASIRTWLTGILKHKIIDYLRKAYQDDDPPADDQFQRFADFWKAGKWKGHWIGEIGPVEWDNPHTFLENKEFWRIFNKCLEELPPKLAAIFKLREMEDIPTEKICNDIGVSSTNVWVILHRCRKQLRKCLEFNWIGLGDKPDV